MEKILSRVKENIVSQGLIHVGEKVLVSFSGGPDSTALLHILHKLSKSMKYNLGACYINHNIRPRASKREAVFCADFCRKLCIPYNLIDADIPEYAGKERLSLEEAGRIFRREALVKLARDDGYNKIALGHHLDDIVETILFRLFRGTGPQGVMPIKPISGAFIRPLFNLTKKEILGYLKKQKVEFLLDRSNIKSDFSRNYIRNEIVPMIKKKFGRKYRNSIYNFAQLISEENRFLDGLTRKEAKKISRFTPGGKIVVDLKKLSAYDLWLRRRIIKHLLESITARPGAGSFDEIERVMGLLESGFRSVNLGDDIRVARDRDSLVFARKKIRVKKRILNLPGSTEIEELSTGIVTSLIPAGNAIRNVQKKRLKVHIDCDSLVQPIAIRGIIAGDRFQPLGMNGTKKVGDYLTDKKIPHDMRDEILLVTDKKGIIWLAGMEIADRVKIKTKTKRVLEIELIRRKSRRAQRI
jgi:tRNA(Ile)-lysidine synthase